MTATMTPSQVAKHFHVSTTTVFDMIKRGDLKATKRGQGRWQIDPNSVRQAPKPRGLRVTVPPSVLEIAATYHEAFAEKILPAVHRHALKRLAANGFKQDDQEELAQEACCLAWRHFVSLIHHGKHDPFHMIGLIVVRAIKSVQRFQLFVARENHKDIMSRRAQRIHGFKLAFDSTDRPADCTVIS